MVKTYYRQWAFPLKSDSLDKSYDIFIQTLRGIDKDLGSTIIQAFGTKIKYFWDTQEERNSQTGMQVGDIGLQLSDSGVYIYESNGVWRLTAQISPAPIIKYDQPTQNDYNFNKGQIWVDTNSGKIWFSVDNSTYDAVWKSFDNEISGKFVYDGLLFLDYPINGILVNNQKFHYLITQNGKFYFRSNISHTLYLGKFKIGSFTPDSTRRTYFLKNDIIELRDAQGNVDNIWAARLLHMTSLLLKKDNGFYSFVKTEAINLLERWYDNTYHYSVIDLTNIAKDEQKYNEFVTKYLEFKGSHERSVVDLNQFIYSYNESVAIQHKIVSEDPTNPEKLSLKTLQLFPLDFVQPQIPKVWGEGIECKLNEVTPESLEQKITYTITSDEEFVSSPDVVVKKALRDPDGKYAFLRLYKNNSLNCESGLANQLKFFYEYESNPGVYIEDTNPVVEFKDNENTVGYKTGTVIDDNLKNCLFYFCNKEGDNFRIDLKAVGQCLDINDVNATNIANQPDLGYYRFSEGTPTDAYVYGDSCGYIVFEEQ